VRTRLSLGAPVGKALPDDEGDELGPGPHREIPVKRRSIEGGIRTGGFCY
jgi:hypothetical protein